MSSHKVLVVEDDFATGELLKEILEQNDYQVVIRTDGISALKAVDEDTFDLALVDVMLPNLNGFQICERIRDDPRNELMPIIILTVLSESQHRIRALQAGATSFLNKPFDRMELLTQIHTLINLSNKIAKRECFDDIVSCFLTMLCIRNPEILAHSQRVAKLAEQLAYRMGLPLSVTNELKAGALLHDIGKLCLDRASGDSTGTSRDESPLPRRHADWGDRMFSHFHRPLARSIIRLHHDDGSVGGALSQIGDRQINLSVQIVAVCNRFDNLVQAGAQSSDVIQNALSLLDDEVKANGWDREVYAKLVELTKTFGNGLFTVFAPE
jgi:putative two-component system response regulator